MRPTIDLRTPWRSSATLARVEPTAAVAHIDGGLVLSDVGQDGHLLDAGVVSAWAIASRAAAASAARPASTARRTPVQGRSRRRTAPRRRPRPRAGHRRVAGSLGCAFPNSRPRSSRSWRLASDCAWRGRLALDQASVCRTESCSCVAKSARSSARMRLRRSSSASRGPARGGGRRAGRGRRPRPRRRRARSPAPRLCRCPEEWSAPPVSTSILRETQGSPTFGRASASRARHLMPHQRGSGRQQLPPAPTRSAGGHDVKPEQVQRDSEQAAGRAWRAAAPTRAGRPRPGGQQGRARRRR